MAGRLSRSLGSYRVAPGTPSEVSGRLDLNQRPHRPERCALPGCATPRGDPFCQRRRGLDRRRPTRRRLSALLSTASPGAPRCRRGPLTTTDGPSTRQAAVGGERRVGLDPVRYLGRVARLLPGIEVEVRDRVADVLEELVGDGVRGSLVLVAEQEVDVLPLAVLLARRRRGVGGLRRLGLAGARCGGTRASPRGVRAYCSINGSTVCELVVVAARALEVAEDGDRDRRVARAEVGAVLGNPGDQLLGLLAAADRDLLGAPFADREGDDRRQQADGAGAQQQARQPRAPCASTRRPPCSSEPRGR